MPAVSGGVKAFLDTNVLVYAFTKDDPKTGVAESLLTQGCCIGVQGLNEFVSVARRKLKLTWPEVGAALMTIRSVSARVVPLDLDVHASGIALAARYRLSVYDGLMLAAARKAGCATFWSEDLQDGLTIDGGVTVRNPFV